MNLLSDQVDKNEIMVITRELRRVIGNHVAGDVVEFGCYLGTTSVFIAEILKDSERQFYVYDSFEGLPEKTSQDQSPLGLDFKPGELLAPKKQFIKNMLGARVPMPIIKKAWFDQLTDKDVPHKVAFAFLDGDYYRSIKDPLKLIAPYLSDGATIIVDDYGNQALPGAALATNEWLAGKNHSKKAEHSLAVIYIKR